MATYIEISEELANEVLAGTREKGLYKVELPKFVDAGIRGTQIDLESGPFKGKKAATVAAGFNSAIEKLALKDTVRVVNNDGRVFLVNKELV